LLGLAHDIQDRPRLPGGDQRKVLVVPNGARPLFSQSANVQADTPSSSPNCDRESPILSRTLATDGTFNDRLALAAAQLDNLGGSLNSRQIMP
jgi:hypothetical protein